MRLDVLQRVAARPPDQHDGLHYDHRDDSDHDSDQNPSLDHNDHDGQPDDNGRDDDDHLHDRCTVAASNHDGIHR